MKIIFFMPVCELFYIVLAMHIVQQQTFSVHFPELMPSSFRITPPTEEVMCATCAHIFPINPNTLFTFPFCCLPGISGRNKSLTIDMKIPMLEKGRPPLIKRKNNILQHHRPGVF